MFSYIPWFYPDLDLVTMPRRARSGTQMEMENFMRFMTSPRYLICPFWHAEWHDIVVSLVFVFYRSTWCMICMCLPLHLHTWAHGFCFSHVVGNLCTLSVDIEEYWLFRKFFVFIQNKLVSVDKPKASQELITHGWAMRRFQVVRKFSETLLSAMRVPRKSK